MITSEMIEILKNGTGAGVDCRKMGIPRTINYAGSPGDQIDFMLSADGSGYGSVGLIGTANALGQFVLVVEPVFAYVAAKKIVGRGGYCAISAVQTGENPTVLLPTGLAGIAGPWVDCRSLRVPRSLLYLGQGGDTVLIEGSSDGDSAHAYRIYERGLFPGSTGFFHDERQAAGYVRATQRGAEKPQVSLSSLSSSSLASLASISIGDTIKTGPLGNLTTEAISGIDVFLVTQETDNVNATLPASNSPDVKFKHVVLLGPQTLVVEGIKIPVGGFKTFAWTGLYWAPIT